MCGVAGLVDPKLAGAADALDRAARAMAAELAHRGPDGEGIWIEPEAGVALAHRRLAIVDLTPTGAQPMHSADGRWVVSYNGELYNTEDLRAQLVVEGARFRGTSDTEVLIEAVARWGLARAIVAANGMFAAAFYDRRDRALHLVRDRLGIKPLYWTALHGRIAFASELDALAAVADRPPVLDQAAVGTLVTLGYVLGARSIWKNVRKVEPGTIVTFESGREPAVARYWSPAEVAAAGAASPMRMSDEDATDALAALLLDAVRRQMVSDVPIGAFLSGGIDSTTVVALMQATGPRPVRSFTIAFDDRTLDEAGYAAAVARHLGTEHTELVATEAEALAMVPRLADIYDEPFADSSQIPTALVSALTRKHLSVALSGDGGDEVFAGYNRHRFAAGPGRWIARWPSATRQVAGAFLSARPVIGLAGMVSRLAPGRLPSQLDDKLLKLADTLRHDEIEAYCRLVTQQGTVDPAIERELLQAFAIPAAFADRLSAVGRMQYRDTITYLPDDILTKVDRASMAVALEVRVPLLDHRVVEFAWRLPAEMRVRNGETKWLLRRVLDRFVPRRLSQRPKQGFAVPLAAWLRGPLRDWASSLIANPDFGGGIVDPAPVRALWTEHIGGRNRAHAIWPFLMFEAWRGRAPSRHVMFNRAR